MIGLPKYEIFIYFLIYVIFLIYGIIHVYLIRDKLVEHSNFGFTKSFAGFESKRDDSDDEWENFKMFLVRNYIWYLCHLFISEIVRRINYKLVPLAHAIIGLAFMLATYHMDTVFTILCLLITFYYTSILQRKYATWSLAVIWIAVINILKTNSNLNHYETYEEYYELIIALSWCLLKCLSFSLSNNPFRCNYSLMNYCGYILYFPTFIYGPFMIFERYCRLLEPPPVREQFDMRFLKLTNGILQVFVWFLIVETSLHFIYVYYLEHNLEMVKTLNPWALYGFGYLMGQFFHCHYVISYGVGRTIASFDRIDPPCQPKCIGRIHFYSDMWKYFDQGLYEFLFKYIYAGLCKKNDAWYKKLFASIVTFAFIYIWHGFFTYVLIWTVLNFICLCLEKLFKVMIHSEGYKTSIAKYLNHKNQIRLYGLIGTQIFIPSAISNFYFFAGIDIGNYFMMRTYQSGFLNYIGLTGCCYCIFQCSDFFWEFNIEEEKAEKLKNQIYYEN